jgi:hypothetical protein
MAALRHTVSGLLHAHGHLANPIEEALRLVGLTQR